MLEHPEMDAVRKAGRRRLLRLERNLRVDCWCCAAFFAEINARAAEREEWMKAQPHDQSMWHNYDETNLNYCFPLQ